MSRDSAAPVEPIRVLGLGMIPPGWRRIDAAAFPFAQAAGMVVQVAGAGQADLDLPR